MRNLIVSPEMFVEILSGLIQSGVTFESNEIKGGMIEIVFTGGY